MNDLLAKVLEDPALSDVSPHAPRHELELLVAKARDHRSVTKLQLVLRDGSTMDLEALPQWTVAQLKRAIEREIALRVAATTGKTRSISWKKHWKRWAVEFDGVELDDGRRSLESYGLGSSAVLHFQPRRSKRRVRTNAPAQKRRRTSHT